MKQNFTQHGLLYYNSSFKPLAASAAILTLKPILLPMLSPNASAVLQVASAHSSIYLAAATYGIVNDWFATGESIQYFARGHMPGAIFLNTYDRFSNAFVWGQIATDDLAHQAGLMFSIMSLYLSYQGLIEHQVLAPTVIIASALLAVLTELIMKFPLVNSKMVNSYFVELYNSKFLGSFDERVKTSLEILKKQNKLDLFSSKLDCLPLELKSGMKDTYINYIKNSYFLNEDYIKWFGPKILTLYKRGGSDIGAIDNLMIDMCQGYDVNSSGPTPYRAYKDSYLEKEQTIGIVTDEQKYNWIRCSVRNTIGYAVMPTLGVLGLFLYKDTRLYAYTFTPNLDIHPVAQIVFPAVIFAGLLYGDYHVRNHERTWEGEPLPKHYLP